jgi:hypothetical protein
VWCANCQSDVASELSKDNRRLFCATCGTELSRCGGNAPPETQNAKDLLERWSATAVFDPYGPPLPKPETNPKSPLAGSKELKDPTLLTSIAPKPRPVNRESLREDTPMSGQRSHDLQSAVGIPWKKSVSAIEETPKALVQDNAVTKTTPTEVPRADAGHDPGPRKPHFDVQQAISAKEDELKKGPNWVSLAGQFLAYGGVLGLTLGTSLVLWGYFGGPAHYAPTGWLITTAGQMLLFLGVVTLVSGGMEQTTEEVSRKIDTLGDRMLRIELVAQGHQLGGPKLPAESFARKPESQDAPPSNHSVAAR